MQSIYKVKTMHWWFWLNTEEDAKVAHSLFCFDWVKIRVQICVKVAYDSEVGTGVGLMNM